MSRRTPISAKQLAARGWTRTDPRPWRKTTARLSHPSGWRLEHCGHPTAHWPWALYSPEGELVLRGVAGIYREPVFGTAFADLEEATAAVEKILEAGGLEAWIKGAPLPPLEAFTGRGDLYEESKRRRLAA